MFLLLLLFFLAPQSRSRPQVTFLLTNLVQIILFIYSFIFALFILNCIWLYASYIYMVISCVKKLLDWIEWTFFYTYIHARSHWLLTSYVSHITINNNDNKIYTYCIIICKSTKNNCVTSTQKFCFINLKVN